MSKIKSNREEEVMCEICNEKYKKWNMSHHKKSVKHKNNEMKIKLEKIENAIDGTIDKEKIEKEVNEKIKTEVEKIVKNVTNIMINNVGSETKKKK